MKKSYKFLLTSVLLVAMVACNDDFLDKLPETSIGTENFFNTEEDLNIYINNLYNFPGFGNYLGDRATDNATTTGNTELKTMMVGSPSSSTITGGWNWGDLRTINLFLENYERAQVDQETLDHYGGLARFFRARFYMDKVKRFSDVPWYEEVIDTNEDELLFKERDNRDFVVGKIFEDYDFAAEHVFANQPSGAVNQWVVKTYKARHALYEGTFRKYHPELQLQASADDYLRIARDVAKDIMDNSGFSIYNTGNTDSDYFELFNSTNLESNSEVILPRIYEHETLNSGWTSIIFGNFEVSPSKDLLQSYLMTDGSYYTDQSDYEENLFVEEFENRDPRLRQTYAFPGWELIYTSTYSQGGGIYIQQLQKNFSGYHQIKGFLNGTDESVNYSVDFPVVRFAEILLTYAEAKAELGELSQTDLDITVNVLRDRVGMPHLTMGPALDAVQAARYPNVQGGQVAEILEIRRERRVEFALEGYRYDDVMRWAAGTLLEKEPEGIYFPSLGNYDLTGDGVDDIKLIAASESIPSGDDKEVNSLGVKLIYYRAGMQGDDASVYLRNGNSGTVQTVSERGVFEEPKYYYRPIPATHVTVNPNLKQIFGWD
ncbi:RagB/SusD family nutrient uptake outer membrane protein [Fulvivirgaceae bacterium BMA10]|uniref:RagB/SusD family nutrient uptake outer membrane protein n=1 Tax=Splendidivirga corallicola TaxID=3051826 RepID=A0ABT8KVZ0_9BACT|nr:RagB/SusD family nutrient uptake outer membrane protein [Fulvivirgaceae bacterium BMA10]